MARDSRLVYCVVADDVVQHVTDDIDMARELQLDFWDMREDDTLEVWIEECVLPGDVGLRLVQFDSLDEGA